MAQILKYVIGKDYRPLTVLEAKGGNTFTPDYGKENWVQGRQYEDSLRQVFVEITNEDGSAYDLTGANVLFEGILPDNEHKILDNSHVVFYEDPTTGKFRFDMPAQAFSVAGQYKQAFFRVVKDYRNIATLEFKFEVLADMVVTGMVARDYISPLEEFFNAIKDEQIKDSAELKKIVDDKINEITNLMTALNQTNTATLSELSSAKTAVEALQGKIEQNGLFTQGEARSVAIVKKNSVADMVSDENLIEKCIVQTSGYYNPGDGGDALYYISSAVPNNSHYETLKNGLYAKLLSNDKVNIKQLGAQSGKGNDISNILNKYTQFYNLYIPEGEFYMASPVKLVKSLEGTGKGRVSSSKIISSISSGETAIDGTNLLPSAHLTGFDFVAGAENVAIKVEINEYKNLVIKDISIENLTNIGLLIQDNFGTSRAVYVDGLTVFGNKNNLATSVGFKMIGARDSKLQNFEIMGCQTSVYLENTFVYVDKMHCWCGSLVGVNSEWQKDTTAFYLKESTAFMDYCMTDSTAKHFYFDGTCSVTISTLIAMNDDNFLKAGISSALIDGDESIDKNFKAVTGTIFIDDTLTNFAHGNLSDVIVQLKTSRELYFARKSITGLQTSQNFNVKFSVTIPANVQQSQATLVAKVLKKKFGRTTFKVANNNETAFNIDVYFNGEKIVITKKTTGISLQNIFYKITDEAVDFYVISTPGTLWDVDSLRSDRSSLLAGILKPEIEDISGLTPVKEFDYSNNGDSLKFRLNKDSSAIVFFNENIGALRFNGEKLILTEIVGHFDKVSFYSVGSTGLFMAQVKSGTGTIKVLE